MMKHIFALALVCFLAMPVKAQEKRCIEIDGINYRILREADESETFGLASVTAKKKGKYYGDVVVPSGFKEGDDEYADKYMVFCVEMNAFANCPELASVELPASVKYIESHAFYNTPKLQTVKIPYGNMTEIGLNAFYQSGLRTMKLPGSIKSIDINAFKDCVNLTDIELPSNLRIIEDSAFKGCLNLEWVTFDGNFADIETSPTTFVGCKKLFSNDVKAVIVDSPVMAEKGKTHAEIKRILITNFATVIEMTADNAAYDGSGYYQWVNISPDTYISAMGEHFVLTEAEGIAISPEYTEYTYINQKISFKLFFPPISKEVKTLSLIESETGDWQFIDIKIQ